MYKHIIFFKFKPNVEHKRCLVLLSGLNDLKTYIPEIINLYIGINDEDNSFNKGFKYAFVMEFESKKTKEIYQNHYIHQKYITNNLNPFIDDAIVFDMNVIHNF